MKSHTLTYKIDKIRKLLQVGFPNTVFVVEHDNERPIVRWNEGPEAEDIYEAAELIGIRRNEFICFKVEIK